MNTWVVTFDPTKNVENGRPWKGEALVHPDEFQPMSIITTQAFKIPLAVKIMLGTNFKQMGFSVTYARVAEGLWFPATYGTEFGFRVLFGYARNITISLKNSEFRKAAVDSTVTFAEPTPPAEAGFRD